MIGPTLDESHDNYAPHNCRYKYIAEQLFDFPDKYTIWHQILVTRYTTRTKCYIYGLLYLLDIRSLVHGLMCVF